MVERLGDLLAVLLLAVGGLVFLTDAIVYFVVAALMVGGMTLVVSNRSIYGSILSQIARIPKLSAMAQKVLRLFDTGRDLLRPLPFLVGVGIATIAWTCEGVAFHVLIQAFGVKTQILTSCSIYGVATLVGAVGVAGRSGQF